MTTHLDDDIRRVDYFVQFCPDAPRLPLLKEFVPGGVCCSVIDRLLLALPLLKAAGRTHPVMEKGFGGALPGDIRVCATTIQDTEPFLPKVLLQETLRIYDTSDKAMHT